MRNRFRYVIVRTEKLNELSRNHMSNIKAVKLRDIALSLGLSVSTVSRAMSGNGRVSQTTRQRVLAAVEQVSYTPNDVARSLRMRDAKNIGIIVTDITNSFFSSVIKGAQIVSRQKGYSILLSNSDENLLFEEEALQLMLEKQISGLILASVGSDKKKLAHYLRLNVPIVFIDNMPALEGPFDSVSVDNYRASHELTNKLIRRGYRDIGMVTGPLDQSSGWQRMKGFENALLENSLPFRPEWVREGDFKMKSGQQCLETILELPNRPAAMILGNNYMAYGAINAIRQAGFRIPQDMAVASFDVDDFTSLMNPSITTMNQPAEEIGRKAADILIARIAGTPVGFSHNLILDPIFVEGNSW